MPVLAIIFIFILSNIFLKQDDTQVIDVHQDDFTAAVIVNHLPYFQKSKIEWWIKNKDSIVEKNHITPGNEQKTMNYVIYDFGGGYVEEDKKDRLCFEDMKPPKNCLDKDILMTVMRKREGGTQFIFNDDTYIQDANGKIYKEK
ncbi:hypothetical protein HA50_19150 [Pantoea cypripedii]|uniref:DUF943 domain-containing protein n=1 Tax=Pantoea cypripedii TaxID=55209 RepID=A0A1X1F0N7_PANCY|nr:hypothetical protein HA50_19150 [Pantoea cypripedii]